MSCSEAMENYECKKNNRKDSFEQYLPEKLAAVLHDCCWNVAGV